MQTIVREDGYKFIHPIFKEYDRLYTVLSNNDGVRGRKQLFDCSETFDKCLQPFENIFNQYGNCKTELKYTDKKYPVLPKKKYPEKTVIIAFSGGKDSTATALYYKERGYEVYLYHVHGLNRFFPYELQSAQKTADYLKLPLVVESVSLSGTSLYPDHPLKNIIIANMALQWGIEHGVGTFISFGDYYTAYLRDVCFETAGDDCVEMWEAYTPTVERYIPGFKFETPLENVADTLARLEKDKTLLGLTQSCVMTHRFKDYHTKRVQAKYKVKLLPNRCGTCWKCALEYIYYTDHNVLKYNKEYYKYCLEVLQRTLKQETGVKRSFEGVWDYYFFYDRKESKFWEE